MENAGESTQVAEPSAATMPMVSVAMKMARRPRTSASAPKTSWPKTAPTMAAVARSAACAVLCGYSVAMMFLTMLMQKRS